MPLLVIRSLKLLHQSAWLMSEAVFLEKPILSLPLFDDLDSSLRPASKLPGLPGFVLLELWKLFILRLSMDGLSSFCAIRCLPANGTESTVGDIDCAAPAAAQTWATAAMPAA